jgi:hypothetical protein
MSTWDGFRDFQLCGGIAMLVASVLAGGLWKTYGPPATFLVGAGFAMVALIGLVFAEGWGRKTMFDCRGD